MKSHLRAQVRACLKQISPEERRVASDRACGLLGRQDVWRTARSVLFYAPLADELDLSPLWTVAESEGKIVALPQFNHRINGYIVCALRDSTAQLTEGKFGIGEPNAASGQVPLNQLDLIMVPGVAFDLSGRRLGRGRGYYDRLLSGVRGTKCGVAFEQQIQTEVPVEPHDVRLDCLLTPARWISFGQSPVLK